MKLKSEEISSMDLASEELDYLKKENDEFWKDMENLMMYGVPSQDEKGHYRDIHLRIRPIQLDIISGIRERIPDGWYKSQSSLLRSILAVGCRIYLKFLETNKPKWSGVLTGLNEIAKRHRLVEFYQDTENLKADILKTRLSPDEKMEIINSVDRLRSRLES